MKATHQVKGGGEDVMAWQFRPGNDVPMWVFRNFHDLGDGSLTHRSGERVGKGQWIVVPCDQLPAQRVAMVFTEKEFQDNFVEIHRRHG